MEAGKQYGAQRLHIFKSILGCLPPGRLLDLGAGHGDFSRAAVDLHWEAVALDARETRFPEDLRDRVEFRLEPVEELGWDPTEFDLILFLGLHYHLTFGMQDAVFAHCSGVPILLDTHFAVEGAETEFSPALSQWEAPEGIPGQVYGEMGAVPADERRNEGLLASFNNDSSFWPTRAGLREHLRRHGYSHVWEYQHPFASIQRTFFLAMPTHADRG